MNKSIGNFVFLILVGSAVVGLGLNMNSSQASSNTKKVAPSLASESLAKAIFAGGCFWCIEADFEKLDGVTGAVSGYTGGEAATATYKQVSYTETGHYEAVEVTYDPEKVSYAKLVEYFWRHIDPTDPNGQFCDKGSSYKSAIFYGSDHEKDIVNKSLENLRINKPFDEDIVTAVIPAQPFYDAEKHHQDYYKKNPIRYKYYRNGCRRDNTVNRLWGGEKG